VASRAAEDHEATPGRRPEERGATVASAGSDLGLAPEHITLEVGHAIERRPALVREPLGLAESGRESV
jgi:hypothetical protein